MPPLFVSAASSSSAPSSTRPTQLHRPQEPSGKQGQRSSSWSAWAVKPLLHTKDKARSSSHGQRVNPDLGKLANLKNWRKKREEKNDGTLDEKGETSDGNGTVRRNVTTGRRFSSGAFVRSSLEELREDAPLEVVSDDAIGDDTMPIPGAWLEEQQQPGAGRPDYSHWTDLRQRLEEQAKISEKKQKKQAEKRAPSSKHLTSMIHPQHRAVSQEDYLTARGANPRTGVVSPTILSVDTTSGSRNSLEGPKHFVPNQKWRLKGNQWISLDADEQTPPPTPPADGSSGPDQATTSRPMGRPDPRVEYLNNRYNSAASSPQEPGTLSMTTRQIVDYHKAIERVYRDGGEMLPPSALPSPRVATPEGRSTSPGMMDKWKHSLRLRKTKDDQALQMKAETGEQATQDKEQERKPDNGGGVVQHPIKRNPHAPVPKQLFRARDALQRVFRGDGPQSSTHPVSEQESFLGNGEANGEYERLPNSPSSLATKGSHSPPPPWTNELTTEDQELSLKKTNSSRFYPLPSPASTGPMALGIQPHEKVLSELRQEQAKFLHKPMRVARKPCITTITTTTTSTPTNTTVIGPQESNAPRYSQSPENVEGRPHLDDEWPVPASPPSLYTHPTNGDALTRTSTASTNPGLGGAGVNRSREKFSDLRSEGTASRGRAGSIPTLETKNGAFGMGYLSDDDHQYFSDASLSWGNLVPILDGVVVGADPGPSGNDSTGRDVSDNNGGEDQRGRSGTTSSARRRRPQCSSCSSVWLCPGDDDDSPSSDGERPVERDIPQFHEEGMVWVNLIVAVISAFVSLLIFPIRFIWLYRVEFISHFLNGGFMVAASFIMFWAAPVLVWWMSLGVIVSIFSVLYMLLSFLGC